MCIGNSKHTSATVPQFDFVACPCGKVDIKVLLVGQGFHAVDLAVMRADNAMLDISVAISARLWSVRTDIIIEVEMAAITRV